jgi:DNA-binding winged helix-turn-helix (wHTH) protein
MTHATTFAFGPYHFIPRRQLLLKNGQAVRIGCRALDLLTAFVRRPGEVLTKNVLMDEAWPNTTVVEGNLKVHIAALRRVLDDDADRAKYIATVNGRGYRFIAPVSVTNASTAFADTGVPQMLSAETQPARIDPLETRFREFVSLLTETMRSAVVDLPVDTQLGGLPDVPRRVLCIELGARDEAWVEGMFAQRLKMISATR